MFSSTFLLALVVAALIWTSVGALVLIILLVRDIIQGKLW